MANPAAARFGPNRSGEDYIVGDVHGCFDQLETSLARFRFNPETDRVFAVGDLVDRGPKSEAALEWLEHPWFHSCLGNHDEMVISDSQNSETLLWWTRVNGGEWWLTLPAEVRQRFIHAFSNLPITMEIETPFGRVGLVHGDVPRELAWGEFVARLEAGDPKAREAALWGRGRADGFVTAPVGGIDRVVCGHTIMPGGRPHVVANVWFVDGGAFLSEAGALVVLPMRDLFDDGSLRLEGLE